MTEEWRIRNRLAHILESQCTPEEAYAECLDLFRLARDVTGVPVLDVAARRRPLEVAIELDPVRRVEVDALHLST